MISLVGATYPFGMAAGAANASSAASTTKNPLSAQPLPMSIGGKGSNSKLASNSNAKGGGDDFDLNSFPVSAGCK